MKMSRRLRDKFLCTVFQTFSITARTSRRVYNKYQCGTKNNLASKQIKKGTLRNFGIYVETYIRTFDNNTFPVFWVNLSTTIDTIAGMAVNSVYA